MVQQATLIDFVNKLAGKNVKSLFQNNKVFFKFADFKTQSGQLSKLFQEYQTKRNGRFVDVQGSTYIDFPWTLEVLIKQGDRQIVFVETFVETINSTNLSTFTISSQINNSQNQTSNPTISEQIPTPHSNNDERTQIQSTPNEKKRKKQEIDKENKKNAKTVDLQEKEQSKKKKKTNHDNTAKKTPSKQSEKKIERERTKTELINKSLQNLRSIDTISKNKLVDLSDINLIAHDSERTPIISRNSFRASIEENSLRNAKDQCDIFMNKFTEMSHLCNIEMSHILFAYFRKNPIYWMEIAHAISMCYRHPIADEKAYSQIRQFVKTKKGPSIEYQLKTKDDLGLSDNSWKETAFLSNTNMKASLTEETNVCNGLVVKFFNFTQVQNGFRVKLLYLVLAAVKAHLHQMNVRKRDKRNLPLKGKTICEDIIEGGIFLPDNLKLKISMDGRKLDSLATVVVTLQILNLQTYGTQDPKAVFPLCIYIGDEADVLSHMHDFEKEVKDLAENGLNITHDDDDIDLGFPRFDSNNQKIIINLPCEFYWVSDLKSLSYVSMLKENNCFCLKCNCTRDASVSSLNNGDVYYHRDLNHSFGITNIYFCVLHMDERITEYLLKMVLIGNNESKIREEFNKIHGLKDFQFKDKEKEEQSLNISEYAFMLTGLHCAKIFGHFESIFGFLNTHETQTLYCILKEWREIRKWLYLKSSELEKKSFEEFEDLKTKLREWGKNIAKIRQSAGSVGDYIHIVVNHLHHFLTKVGSLVPFSNQAVEHSHKYDRWLMQRCVSKRKMLVGSKNTQDKSNVSSCEDSSQLTKHQPIPNSNSFSYDNIITSTNDTSWNNLFQICQIFLKKLRILFLSFRYDDVVFKRLELRVGSVQKLFWERDLNDIGEPLRHLVQSLNDHESNVGVHSPSSQQSLTASEELALAEYFQTQETMADSKQNRNDLENSESVQNKSNFLGLLETQLPNPNGSLINRFTNVNHLIPPVPFRNNIPIHTHPEDAILSILHSLPTSEDFEVDAAFISQDDYDNFHQSLGQDDQDFYFDFPSAEDNTNNKI